MSRVEWNKAGERFFETGIDQVVLYPPLGSGVPWNGVVAVNESASTSELEPLYYDGIKYMDVASAENFQLQLDAFSAPAEFGPCDGQKQLSPGLFVTQQPRKTFGLSYRTLKGNDLVSTELGYKLHLVWNCTAAPSGKNNQTISSTVTPDVRSWQIGTVPLPATTFKPTAHIVLDSELIEPYALAQVEGLLYGHANGEPYLPTVAEIVATLDTRIGELVTEFI